MLEKSRGTAKGIESIRGAIVILVIDNYDSFTFNLVQYLGELGQEVKVYRNNHISTSEIKILNPDYLVLSPGPGTPNQAGISVEIVQKLSNLIPILGVCLGHQSIGQAFGAKIIRAPSPMHGKTSFITHDGLDIYKGLPNPFEATRYHSLTVDEKTLPSCLEVTAHSEDGLIMGLKHISCPVFGIQFHPESILTKVGKQLLKNFLELKGT